MATERNFLCSTCGHKERSAHLFDALKEVANGSVRRCSGCQQCMQLELKFPFGLEHPGTEGKVLDAFLPTEIGTWTRNDGATVRFYPFLVIFEQVNDGYRSAWLPYWHIVSHSNGKIERKYGQWAPFIGEDRFASLLEQAQKKGYNF